MARLLPVALLALLGGCAPPAAAHADLGAGDLPPLPAGQPPLPSPPPNTVGGFEIRIPPMTLRPGDERFPCYVLPLLLEGPTRIVGGASLTVGPGLHHGNILTHRQTGDQLRVCNRDERGGEAEAIDVVQGGSVLFGSSTQFAGTEWQRFPEGMGYRVRDDQEIVARLHYINASNATITVAPIYRWYTIAEAALKTELAPFAWDYREIRLPPKRETTLTGRCLFLDPMHVVSVLPHMHALGTRFTAGFLGGPRDGQLWLDSKGYDPDQGVLRQFEPAIDLGQAHGATFACTWNNTFDKEIEYGVGDDEMCVLFGYAYPVWASYTTLIGEGGRCSVIAAAPRP